MSVALSRNHRHRLEHQGLVLDDNPIQTVDPETIALLHVRWLKVGDYPLSLEVIKNITLGVSNQLLSKDWIFHIHG